MPQSIKKTFKDLPVGATFFLYDDVQDPFTEFQKVDHKSAKRCSVVNELQPVTYGCALPFHDKEQVITLRMYEVYVGPVGETTVVP